MLTDRQQKFYNQIKTLLLLSSSASLAERRVLFQAKDDIERGKDFKGVIKTLMKNLQEGATIADLSAGVQELYDQLCATYGESENKQSEDAEYLYVGDGGRYGGHWERRDDIKKAKKPYRFSGLDIIRAILVVITFAALIFTPLLNWLQKILGNTMFAVLMFVIGISVVIGLIKAGNLKKKK